MTMYDKKFSPAKASAPAAALYDALADGQPRSRTEIVTVIEAAVPANGTTDLTPKRRRAVATNTLYVARRTGRITEDNDTIVLNADAAAQWRQYKGNMNTPVATITTITEDSNDGEFSVAI